MLALVTAAILSFGVGVVTARPAEACRGPAARNCIVWRDNHARKAERARFRGLDKDRDGTLSRDEAAANRRLARRFATLDTDHDGRLSFAEVPRHLWR